MGSFYKVPFRLMLLLLGAAFTFAGLISTFAAGPITYTAQDLWARVLLVVFGLSQVISAIYLEIRARAVGGGASEERSMSVGSHNLRNHYDKFSEISEGQFLDKVVLSKVSHLDILGHTGQSIYIPFRQQLEELIDKGSNYPGEIRILIRAPIAEGLRRNHYVHNTIIAVRALRQKHKNVDVRFFEAVPAIRGIICQYREEDQARDIYMTSYYWDSANKTKSFPFAYVTRDVLQKRKPEVKVLESWINQYWGKDEIHTVVFDFDDTLVKTRDVQVRAWAQAIVECLTDNTIKEKNLSPKFRDWISQGSVKSAADPILLEIVKNVFLDKQLAEAIAQEIFVGINNETIKQINQKRFDIRTGMMHRSELFEGVEKMLKKLNEHYNLAIISSTDEQLIENFLTDKNLIRYFTLILGKRDPSLKYEREQIHHKSSLLIKLSQIIGMPLTRLVYIGDNKSDYEATRQLGVAFIEARQAAALVGKATIISDVEVHQLLLGSFSSFETDELPEILRNHSQNLTNKKYQI
jgi:phosphoglycolate phosphatase-like HAD superfamily hydrolase